VIYFPQDSPPKLCIHFCSLPYALHVQPLSFSSILSPETLILEEYRSFSSSLFSFLYSPVTSSLLGPSILLSTLFSNTYSLRSSLRVSDQVLNPYKTTNRIIVMYILIFKFLDSKLEDNVDI
jgi:hypothetical protein